ncbi:MAG: HEAT repeat domain-containing protein [Acidobacteriota bacterium]
MAGTRRVLAYLAIVAVVVVVAAAAVVLLRRSGGVVVSATPAEIRQAIVEGVRVSGKAVPGETSESWGMSSSTYHQWDLHVELLNQTRFAFALGKEMVLIESDATGAQYEGVVVVRGREPEGEQAMRTASELPDSYSLSNCQISYTNGNSAYRRGSMSGMVTLSVENPQPDDLGFGSLKAGEKRTIDAKLAQGLWVKEEYVSSLRLTLPELIVPTTNGRQRFRMVVYFQKPTGGAKEWTASRLEVFYMDAAELRRLIEVPETNLVTRVLAANWIFDCDVKQGQEAVIRAAQGQREGNLLAAGLSLLIQHPASGLGDHAVKLIDDSSVPNGVRRLAAVYIGAARYQPGLDALAKGARSDDTAVADGAIDGLGRMGGDAAASTLLDLLNKDTEDRQEILSSLARCGAASSEGKLRELARGGDKDALDALVTESRPENFEFFAELVNSGKHAEWQASLLDGLRKSGGERSADILLEALKKDPPPSNEAPLETTAAVDQLTALGSHKAVPQIESLARQGNLRALQVLAASKEAAAKAPLEAIARQAKGTQLVIALNGLSRRWPEGSAELFKAALKEPDAVKVSIAVRGLKKSVSDADLVALLVPLLAHANEEVRAEASDGLSGLDPGAQAPRYFDAILSTADSQVAVDLVTALIDHKWKDQSAVPRLAAKLAKGDNDMKYQTIRLLRHLSGDAMGPADYTDFNNDPDEWVRKWKEWCASKGGAK